MSDSFDIQLSGLRRRFCDRAVSQSADLAKMASELENGADASRWREEIRKIAHSLAGAGGVFGFSELGEQAGELDDFMRQSPGRGELAGACRELISAIGRAVFPKGPSHGD